MSWSHWQVNSMIRSEQSSGSSQVRIIDTPTPNNRSTKLFDQVQDVVGLGIAKDKTNPFQLEARIMAVMINREFSVKWPDRWPKHRWFFFFAGVVAVPILRTHGDEP